MHHDKFGGLLPLPSFLIIVNLYLHLHHSHLNTRPHSMYGCISHGIPSRHPRFEPSPPKYKSSNACHPQKCASHSDTCEMQAAMQHDVSLNPDNNTKNQLLVYTSFAQSNDNKQRLRYGSLGRDQ